MLSPLGREARFLVRRDSNTVSFSLSHPGKIIIRLVNL
jgi:hypothetical protein